MGINKIITLVLSAAILLMTIFVFIVGYAQTELKSKSPCEASKLEETPAIAAQLPASAEF